MNSKVPFWYPTAALKYHILPSSFIVFFSTIVIFLSSNARDEIFSWDLFWEKSKGNKVSWIWVATICSWAYASLRVPSKVVYGPETDFGYRPPYKDNGFSYYLATSGAFLLAQLLFPQISLTIYENFTEILGSFNVLALVFCSFLLLKGKLFNEHPEDPVEKVPLLYGYYRGMELHPRVMGVDVKQLTNCRIGLMTWQIYVFAFFFSGLAINGFTTAAFANMILQTIYIAKFFWWESGYFFTLDMIMDRAGFYICWGCLVLVPCLYTYSSFYSVAHPSRMSTDWAVTLLVIGVLSIIINYRIDYEKQIFRASKNFNCTIWGKKAEFIRAEYVPADGTIRKSALLVSGFWGIARHINYTFELLAAFSWCAAGGIDRALWPVLYFIFLTVLLVHRSIRDEEKCTIKYGKPYQLYCKKVPCRLIPYVW